LDQPGLTTSSSKDIYIASHRVFLFTFNWLFDFYSLIGGIRDGLPYTYGPQRSIYTLSDLSIRNFQCLFHQAVSIIPSMFRCRTPYQQAQATMEFVSLQKFQYFSDCERPQTPIRPLLCARMGNFYAWRLSTGFRAGRWGHLPDRNILLRYTPCILSFQSTGTYRAIAKVNRHTLLPLSWHVPVSNHNLRQTRVRQILHITDHFL
jgi:hypothetical protein